MPIVSTIISNNQQPHDGYGYVGLAGNKGLTAAGKIFNVSLSRPTIDMTAASGNVILGPAYPGTGADRQVGPIGDTVANLNSMYSDRFDDTNYYHGSGSYGGPSN